MGQDQKTYLFEQMPVPRAVMTMATPTILSSLVMVLYNLADTFFVGLLGDPVQNAAVTLAAPVLLAFNAVNNLFGVGGSSMMSRALGRQDPDTARRSAAFSFYCALSCALVLFSLGLTVLRGPLLDLLGAAAETAPATGQYLLWTVSFGAAPAILNVVLAQLVRAEGASLHASVGTMSGCLLNIALDPLMILPGCLDLGAAGAGLATFLANCAACCYFFVLLFLRRGRTLVCLSPRLFCLRRDIVRGVCGVGIPASVQNLLNVTGTTVLNNFASAYGTTAVAAMGIAQKICSVAFHISMGFSQGVMPLVGYNYASGNTRRMKKLVLTTGRLMLGTMALMCLVFSFAAEPLVRLFLNQDAIAATGGAFLRGLCLALPFLGMDFLAVGVFQACGLGRNALLFALLRKVVLEIPALMILNRLVPLYGLAYAQLFAEVVLAGAAVLVLARLFRRLRPEPEQNP